MADLFCSENEKRRLNTDGFKLLINDSVDPFFNLALEEWLMKNTSDPVFVIWQNRPTVVIGRYQNAYAEVNVPYAEEKGISIVRRMSGGGAVYHDGGNLNFTFIADDDGNGIDFVKFLSPIKTALLSLGIETEFSGRNDLLLNGKKISGSAQCRKFGKVLHHGTLLVESDAEILAGVLMVSPEKLVSKGISSVKSRVTNIREYFPNIGVSDIKKALAESFCGDSMILSKSDILETESLAREKYASWDYVFGTSKALSKTVKGRFDGGGIEISFDSENGIIKDISISGDFFIDGEISLLERSLSGTKLAINDLINAVKDAECKIHGISPREIAQTILK